MSGWSLRILALWDNWQIIMFFDFLNLYYDNILYFLNNITYFDY